MVELSLKHRAKLGRQATLLSDISSDTTRRALFGTAVAIAVLNSIFVVAAAVLSGLVGYTWYQPDPKLSHAPKGDGDLEVNRVALIFFLCSIPVVLTTVSIYEVLQRRRNPLKFHSMTAIVLASAGIALWLAQFSLQGSCTWNIRFGNGAPSFCPFEYDEDKDWDGFWSSGLGVLSSMTTALVGVLCLYISHLILEIALLFKQRKASGQPAMVKRTYSYHAPVEETELKTDRDMPSRATTPAPPASAEQMGPPPRYQSHSGSMFVEQLPPEKERDMV